MDKKIKIFDEEVASLMTPADFVASCDAAFRLYGAGEMVNPTREETLTQENGMDVFHLEMPGEWKNKFHGKKVIEERSDVKTGHLGDRSALIALEDVEAKRQIVLDAEHITNMRTGAAGALGAKYLCALPIQKVAILGTGRIAKALALCADVALQPEVIVATSRKEANRQAFYDKIAPKLSCKLHMVDTLAKCVCDASAVLTAIPTSDPILTKEILNPQTLISVLGGDQRTQQLDLELFLSRKIVPDHAEQVIKSGEFRMTKKAGKKINWVKNTQKEIQNIGDGALGRLENLRGQGTIVYFSGMAIQDVHAASVVWQRYQTHKM